MAVITGSLKKNEKIVHAYEEADRLRRLLGTRISYMKNKSAQSVADRDKLKEIKDIHKGKRCFIIGNGPSLTGEDLKLIKDEFSFAVNGAYKTYERVDWRPDYYVLMDDNLGMDVYNGALVDKTKLKCFFNGSRAVYTGDDNRVIGLVGDTCTIYGADDRRIKRNKKTRCGSKISADISKKIYSGKTVIYVAVQIAIYMGFTDIYIMGVDCDFSGRDKHSKLLDDYEERTDKENERLRKAAEDMLDQFDGMAQLAPYYGVNIYNAGRGGRLESFPRVSLTDVMADNKIG